MDLLYENEARVPILQFRLYNQCSSSCLICFLGCPLTNYHCASERSCSAIDAMRCRTVQFFFWHQLKLNLWCLAENYWLKLQLASLHCHALVFWLRTDQLSLYHATDERIVDTWPNNLLVDYLGLAKTLEYPVWHWYSCFLQYPYYESRHGASWVAVQTVSYPQSRYATYLSCKYRVLDHLSWPTPYYCAANASDSNDPLQEASQCSYLSSKEDAMAGQLCLVCRPPNEFAPLSYPNRLLVQPSRLGFG